MEKIKGLAIDLDLDHLSVDRGLKGLKDRIKSVNSEMRANMSAFDMSDRSVKKYETRLDGLNKKLEVQKRVVAEAQKEYEKMVEEYGHGSKEAEKAAREYNNQAAALNNLERYIERTTKELQQLEREQRIANSGWTKLGNKLETASNKMRTASERMGQVGSTLTDKITKPALGAAGALASLTLYKGFQRLIGIDTAKAQLKALGHDAKEVDQIMQAALNSVKGTSHGMDEAATTAASAVAAGVDPVKDLEKYLSLAADTASVANVPFQEMGNIFNKVQTSGKAQNDVLKQLSERGIPIYQYLADTIGTTTEEIEKMARDGKIRTKDFLKAVEQNIGGAAKIIGEESFAAAVKNIGADVARIGAAFLDAGGEGKGFFSTVKPLLVDFRRWLERVENQAGDLGVRFGRAFQNMIEKIKDLKRQYDNLSPAQQELVNKLMLIGPAVAVGVGPALTGLSKLGGGISNVLDFTSRLSKAIGIARSGAGLTAALSALGPGAVAGVAVAGLAAVAVGAYTLYKRSQEAKKVSTELADSLWEQADSLESLADEYDELQAKSKLTTEEFGRLIDIQKDLQITQNPGKVAELQREYEELAKKSGLSNDELDKMIGLNDKIIEQSPTVEKSFSDKGHAIVDTTDAVRDYIKSLRDMALIELRAEQAKALEREKELLEENKQLAEEIRDVESKINELIEMRNMPLEEVDARLEEINRKMNSGLLTQEEYLELEREQGLLLQLQNDNLVDALDTLQEQRKTLIQKRDLNTDELAKLEQINARMAEMLLAQVDINWEQGEGLNQLDEKIKKLQKEREEIVKNTDSEVKKSQEYRTQLKLLDDEIRKHENIREQIKQETGYQAQNNRQLDLSNQKMNLKNHQLEKAISNVGKVGAEQGKTNKKFDEGTKKAEGMTKEAGKDVSKKVEVTDKGSISSLNRLAASPISKTVSLIGTWSNLGSVMSTLSSRLTSTLRNVKFWEKGTPASGHPGGHAIVGEKGSELIQFPSGQVFLSPGTHTLIPNMPKGTHVIPHRESMRIIRNAPRYADGTRNWDDALGNSEFARLLARNRQISEVSVIGGNNEQLVYLLSELLNKIDKVGGIEQNITIISPDPTSPSENARKIKHASRELAMEWR